MTHPPCANQSFSNKPLYNNNNNNNNNNIDNLQWLRVACSTADNRIQYPLCHRQLLNIVNYLWRCCMTVYSIHIQTQTIYC